MFYYCLHIALIPLSLLFCAGCKKSDSQSNDQSKTLRIATETDPQTLDPRKMRDLSSVTVINMLYEGLMRTQDNGELVPGIAESFTLSPDKKTYTFHLRSSAWSNGEPVTAYDFEKSWKSMLTPHFPSPNAYQLYPIRGAKAAYEGKGTQAQIGVHAQNDTTLIVELEQPTPYFLDLTATYFFYPVHASLLKDTGEIKPVQTITNGPFKIDSWVLHNEFSAIANPYYWDKNKIRLDKIQLITLDLTASLQLFNNGELDWAGSPLSTLPVDSLSSLKKEGKLRVAPAAGVYFFRINTERSPFNHVKMRRAFAFALNREDLVTHALQGNQIPATGVIPPSFISTAPLFKDHSLAEAKKLFQEALAEQSITVQDLPIIYIQYGAGERNHKIAQVAEQQWKEAFGVNIQLRNLEGKVHFEKLKERDYQLALGSWFADFRHPISFLEIFKHKDNGTNNTQWENQQFIALLNQSITPDKTEERNQKLRSAEEILISEMPVIPLFFSSYNYLENPELKGVYFSELGYLDFKQAFFE